MSYKTEKTWYFYKKYFEGRSEIVHTQECRMPKRTKVWKELQQELHSDVSLESVGYTHDPKDVWLN